MNNHQKTKQNYAKYIQYMYKEDVITAVHGGNVHHIYLEESTGQLQKKTKKKPTKYLYISFVDI